MLTKMRNRPALVIIGVLIIGALLLPIIPVSTSQTLFQQNDLELPVGYYRWAEYEVGKGSEVTIDFLCTSEVYTYIFTEKQFSDFQNRVDETCIDSIKEAETGTLTHVVELDGVYVFVIYNYQAIEKTINSMEGISKLDKRISLLQKMNGNW
jgi:hypothetical protein